jgi:hypothetical protein
MPKTLYQNIRAFIVSKRLHLICWVIFIFYEVIVTGALLGHFSPLISYLLFYAINIPFFYIHALYVLPYALGEPVKSLWRTPLLTLLELAAYFVLAMGAEKIVLVAAGKTMRLSWPFMAATIWRGIYFLLYGTGYYFLLNAIRSRNTAYRTALRAEKLKSRLLAAEKDFLRAQINPHLLFNTLSFIKYAAKRKPESVEEAILTLSDIMTFSLDENHTEYIQLSAELRQISNIIRLNQLRYEDRLQLNYSATVADGGQLIIPVVLLTLTENIFKHGDLLQPAFPATLKITATPQSLQFQSINLPSYSRPNENKGHHGLQNIASRLENYYQGDYSLTYGLNGQMFVVDLIIHFSKAVVQP